MENLIKIRMNNKKNKFFVAYFDILGYRGRIGNRLLSEEFDIQKNFIDDINKRIKSSKEIIKCDFFNFSDTYILYSENFSRIIRGSLLFMLSAAIKTIPYFPVRGAISYGEFLFDKKENIVIGRALRDAYCLEGEQEWMGCSLSDSCYAVGKHHKSFEYFLKKGVLVKYDVPLKKGKKEERYVINIESFIRIWGKETRNIPITNPEFIKNIFVNKGGDDNNVLLLDDSANSKLMNTQEFFAYIEKIKNQFQ